MELKRYWQILLKRRATLFKIVLIIVGTVILGSFIISPVFSFNCKIWVKTTDPKATLTGVSTELVNLGMASSETVMYSQLAMIKNLPLIQDVITKMRLEKSKGTPFGAADFLEPSAISLLLYKKGVRVKQVPSSQIIQVSGFSGSPEQAAEIANQIGEAFVAFYNQNAQTAAKQSLKFIQENIPKVSAELQRAENDLAEYKVANHLNNVTYLREKLLTNLTSLQGTIDDNETELVNLEKRIASVHEKLKKVPEFHKTLLEYRANGALGYIREKLVDAESSLASGSIRAKAEYFSQKQNQATMDKLKDEYKKQAKKLFYGQTTDRNTLYDSFVRTLLDDEVNLAVRTARRQVLNQIYLARQKDLDDITLKEVTLGSLQRKVTALQTALATLYTQEQSAKLSSDVDLSNAFIVERAAVPAYASHVKNFRWFPRRKLLTVFSLVFGLALGLVTIFGQEYLEDTLSDPIETEMYLHFPVLANLPEVAPAETYELPRLMAYPPWAKAIWALPEMVKPAGQKSLTGVWAVTSCAAGEGKTLVAASLGWTLAIRDLRVLLIDLNFFHPKLASLWQLPPGDGVSELLQGTATLGACLRKVGPGELYLLPHGKADAGLWPRLAPQFLATWLATVKGGFEAVLLDIPAVGAGEGAPLAALADQVLMVVAAGHSPRIQVARALEQIQRCHGQIGGLVFNRSKNWELRPLLAPAVEALSSWPPVQRLSAFIQKHIKFKLTRKR